MTVDSLSALRRFSALSACHRTSRASIPREYRVHPAEEILTVAISLQARTFSFRSRSQTHSCALGMDTQRKGMVRLEVAR
jgi:hypothetical protein